MGCVVDVGWVPKFKPEVVPPVVVDVVVVAAGCPKLKPVVVEGWLFAPPVDVVVVEGCWVVDDVVVVAAGCPKLKPVVFVPPVVEVADAVDVVGCWVELCVPKLKPVDVVVDEGWLVVEVDVVVVEGCVVPKLVVVDDGCPKLKPVDEVVEGWLFVVVEEDDCWPCAPKPRPVVWVEVFVDGCVPKLKLVDVELAVVEEGCVVPKLVVDGVVEEEGGFNPPKLKEVEGCCCVVESVVVEGCVWAVGCVVDDGCPKLNPVDCWFPGVDVGKDEEGFVVPKPKPVVFAPPVVKAVGCPKPKPVDGVVVEFCPPRLKPVDGVVVDDCVPKPNPVDGVEGRFVEVAFCVGVWTLPKAVVGFVDVDWFCPKLKEDGCWPCVPKLRLVVWVEVDGCCAIVDDGCPKLKPVDVEGCPKPKEDGCWPKPGCWAGCCAPRPILVPKLKPNWIFLKIRSNEE